MRRGLFAALLLVAGCGRGEAPRIPDTTTTRAADVQLSGDRVGPVPVIATSATLARFARVVRDTEELGEEGIPESVFVLVLRNDTVRAVHDSGLIYRLDVDSPTFRTMDSLGVGTTLARLLREPGVYASTGEGAVYVGTPHHCGMSFRLSESDGLGDTPRDSIGAAELRQLPPSTRVSEVLVFGCKEPAVAEAPAPRADSTLVPPFLGCYALDDGDGRTFPIRLTDARAGASWRALDFGAGDANAPGDEWSWAPQDSKRFTLSWGGIDGAMQFTVTRDTSAYAATGQSFGAQQGQTELHPTVRKVDCPSTP